MESASDKTGRDEEGLPLSGSPARFRATHSDWIGMSARRLRWLFTH